MFQTRIGNGIEAFNCGKGAWSIPSSSRSPPLWRYLPQQSKVHNRNKTIKSINQIKTTRYRKKILFLLLRVDEEFLFHPPLPRPRLETKLAPGTHTSYYLKHIWNIQNTTDNLLSLITLPHLDVGLIIRVKQATLCSWTLGHLKKGDPSFTKWQLSPWNFATCMKHIVSCATSNILSKVFDKHCIHQSSFCFHPYPFKNRINTHSLIHHFSSPHSSYPRTDKTKMCFFCTATLQGHGVGHAKGKLSQSQNPSSVVQTARQIPSMSVPSVDCLWMLLNSYMETRRTTNTKLNLENIQK